MLTETEDADGPGSTYQVGTKKRPVAKSVAFASPRDLTSQPLGLCEQDVVFFTHKSLRGASDRSEPIKVLTAQQIEKYKSYAPKEELKRIAKARRMLQQN